MIDTYITYFKELSELHPSIMHQDVEGEKAFFIISIEESFGAFRNDTSEKSIVLQLLEPTVSYKEDKQEITGGFLITKYHSTRETGITGYLEAITTCENILNDFFNRMVEDSQNEHELFGSGFDSKQDFNAQIIKAEGDGSYAGWRAIFSWSTYRDDCYDENTFLN